MSLVLRCPSGIAGNLWMAAMLGLGADARALHRLPERLGVPEARIAWDHDADRSVSQVEVHGAAPTPATNYEGLISRVRGAGLAPAVCEHALRVLADREAAEARLLGLDLATRRFADEDVADTLIDVVAGVLLWHQLGRPPTGVCGPVVVGLHPRPSSLALLDGIPVARTGADLPLATPTGAALLRSVWEPTVGTGPAVREVEVPGDFSLQAGLPPLTAALHAAPGQAGDVPTAMQHAGA